MSNYKAPVKDILFATRHLADLEGITALPGYEDATHDLLEAILQEAAKIGEEVLDPLNKVGDIQGSSLNNGEVKTPDGWKEAYSTFIEGGWNGLPFSPDRGGQGLPWLVATAVQEIWHSSNMAFGLVSAKNPELCGVSDKSRSARTQISRHCGFGRLLAPDMQSRTHGVLIAMLPDSPSKPARFLTGRLATYCLDTTSCASISRSLILPLVSLPLFLVE